MTRLISSGRNSITKSFSIAKRIKEIYLIKTTSEEFDDVEFHIPFAFCGDDSTLCGIMSDSGESEGIKSWEPTSGEKVTCSQCIEMLGLVKIVAKHY